MKKSTKVLLAVALVLVIAGGLLAVIGMGGMGFRFDKPFGFIVSRGNTPERADVAEKTYTVSETFRSIDVKSQDGELRLYPAEDGVCRVVCMEHQYRTHTVEVVNGELRIERHNQPGFFSMMDFGKDEIALFLPEQVYESLTVSAASGDATIPESFSFDLASLSAASGDIHFSAAVTGTLTLSAASGDISVDGAEPDLLSVSTGSGDISLSALRVGGKLYAESTSGTIRVKDLRCGEAEVNSTSGDQLLTGLVAEGRLKLHAVSGEIELSGCDGGDVYIDATSGDVTGFLLTEKTFVTHTSSGTVRVPEGRGATCEVHTTSGDIRISVEG